MELFFNLESTVVSVDCVGSNARLASSPSPNRLPQVFLIGGLASVSARPEEVAHQVLDEWGCPVAKHEPQRVTYSQTSL